MTDCPSSVWRSSVTERLVLFMARNCEQSASAGSVS